MMMIRMMMIIMMMIRMMMIRMMMKEHDADRRLTIERGVEPGSCGEVDNSIYTNMIIFNHTTRRLQCFANISRKSELA